MRFFKYIFVVVFNLVIVINLTAKIFYGTSNRGLVIYNKGRYKRPAGIPPYSSVIKIFKTGKSLFFITKNNGLYYCNYDKSYKLYPRNHGLKYSRINKSYDIIKGFYADEVTGYCALTTKHRIYLSYNFGKTWQQINEPSYCTFNSFSSISITKTKPMRILLPTAFNGIHSGIIQRNKKIIWNRGWYGMPGWKMDRRSFTYETVLAAIKVKGGYYSGTAFGSGFYYSKNAVKWKKYNLKLPDKDENILNFRKSNNGFIIETEKELYDYNIPKKTLKKIEYIGLLKNAPKGLGINCLMAKDKGRIIIKQFNVPVNKKGNRESPEAYDRRLRQKAASNKRAVYLNTYLAKPYYKLKSFVNKIKKTKINAVVIDMKDDWGKVVYNSKLNIVKRVGALYPLVDAKKIIKYFKKNKLYTIARLVVFKDLRMFRYKNGKYAIKDRITKKPWIGGHSQKEYWVDPNSNFVWKYNVAIAKELVDLGFDEIQFDYIRFPTDGNIFRCYYSHKKGELNKADALMQFLKYARNNIRVPISIDIYGFNGWYTMGDKQGQDIERLKEYVDVICPMYYPSHFGHLFMGQDVYRIIYDGVRRAKKFTGSYAIIRPYLQSFSMHAPNYGPSYISEQIRGNHESGGNGYIFWNMGGKYRFVYKTLSE